MNKIADVITLVFNPLFILGVARLYTILDSTRQYKANFFELAHYPLIHIPIICCLFSLACSVLSHETNKNYVLLNPEFRVCSVLGILTFSSAACIMLMFYFVVDYAQIFWWFRSYAFLCLVNSAWNFLSVTRQTRFPHVSVNIFLFTLIFSVTLLFQTTKAIYLLLLVIMVTKAWQRSRSCEFKLSS
jgi:hypothetical protein